MLLRIVAVVTVLTALGGLLRVLLAFKKGQAESQIESAREFDKKRRQMKRGWIIVWLSTSAFLFLITGYATPVEILLALALSLAVIVPLTFIKGQIHSVNTAHLSKPPTNDRDASTIEKPVTRVP